MEASNKLNLFKDFVTYQQVTKALKILKLYLEQKLYHQADLDIDSFITINAGNQTYQHWLKEFANSDEAKTISVSNYSKWISDLKELVESTPKIIVYVPFVFPEAKLGQLHKTAVEAVGQFVYLDIKFDEDLLAGCAIVWKGNYKDYSLRSTLRSKQEGVKKLLQQFKTN